MTILTQSKALSTVTLKAAELRKDFGDRIKTIKSGDKYQVVFLGSVEQYHLARLEAVFSN